MIDAHAHVADERFDNDREIVLNRAIEAGLAGIVCVGQDAETSRRAIALRNRGYAKLQLAATAGLHPHEARRASEELPEIERLARMESVAAVGETGLDFYYNNSPREAQRDSFRWHLALATNVNKPVVVHVRDAHEDALADIKNAGRGAVTMIHCFTGGADEARRYLDLGSYISFSGIITFKRAAAVREAARAVPADRLLVETDCPFLAPEGRRGKRCEPAFMTLTIARLAAERGESERDVVEATTRNALRLFWGVHPPPTAAGR